MKDDLPFACAEKISFDTAKQAQTAATVAQYQHGATLQIYRCKDCGLWHLSSSPTIDPS